MFKNPFRGLDAVAAPETLRALAERHGGLKASVYLHRNERFFLSAVQGFNEYLEPVMLASDVDDAVLGQALIDRLRAFDPRDPDLSGTTLKDWRVLQASKARSAKQFNAESLFVHVATMPNLSFQLTACPRDSRHPALYVGAMLGLETTPAQWGGTIRDLLRAVRALREAGSF
jgi:hypothetical protein